MRTLHCYLPGGAGIVRALRCTVQGAAGALRTWRLCLHGAWRHIAHSPLYVAEVAGGTLRSGASVPANEQQLYADSPLPGTGMHEPIACRGGGGGGRAPDQACFGSSSGSPMVPKQRPTRGCLVALVAAPMVPKQRPARGCVCCTGGGPRSTDQPRGCGRAGGLAGAKAGEPDTNPRALIHMCAPVCMSGFKFGHCYT